MVGLFRRGLRLGCVDGQGARCNQHRQHQGDRVFADLAERSGFQRLRLCWVGRVTATLASQNPTKGIAKLVSTTWIDDAEYNCHVSPSLGMDAMNSSIFVPAWSIRSIRALKTKHSNKSDDEALDALKIPTMIATEEPATCFVQELGRIMDLT